jgi:diaminopimelate decarboxylase
MRLDVATGGELSVVLAAGVPAERVVLHGNNKSSEELALALTAGVGRVVVDSTDELDRIEALVAAGGRRPQVLIRVNPGIEVHTHEHVQTGVLDSKFGFPLTTGQAEAALDRAAASAAVDLVGVHLHIGSQVFSVDNFADGLRAVAPFVRDADLPEFVVGGGLGVAYVAGEQAPDLRSWGESVLATCRAEGIRSAISAEPGRAIVASAAITLYTVGTVKFIPGVRTYVAVDGGMSDNPRPVLYGAGYEAYLPTRPDAPRDLACTVVGKHCEQGDVVVADAHLPADVTVGDLLATPATGAYGYSMASTYNKVPRPAVVFVRDGAPRLVVRRETLDDLLRLDVG